MYERFIFINEHYKIVSKKEINKESIKEAFKKNSTMLDSLIIEDYNNGDKFFYLIKLIGRGLFATELAIKSTLNENIEIEFIKRYTSLGKQ